MVFIRTNEQKSQYFYEVAQNCRKKGEMYDKIVNSGKVTGDRLKKIKESSRKWWTYHEEYLERMSNILKTPYPKEERIEEIVEIAKDIFSIKEGEDSLT